MFVFLTVSCQVPVITGFKGEDVLLPCIYKGRDLPKQVSVHWRDKDDKKVLVIIESSPKFNSQDQIFKDRVESFPDVYKDGNFSVILKNLQQTDSGTYICNFPTLQFSSTVQLSVSGL